MTAKLQQKLTEFRANQNRKEVASAIAEALAQGKGVARLDDDYWIAVSPEEVWDGLSSQSRWKCEDWEVVATNEQLQKLQQNSPDIVETLINRVRSFLFISVLNAAVWTGYEEDRLVKLSPSWLLRESEAVRFVRSLALCEDTKHGLVIHIKGVC